jgi:hypothetical protein
MKEYAALGVASFVLGSDKNLVASAFSEWTEMLAAPQSSRHWSEG